MAGVWIWVAEPASQGTRRVSAPGWEKWLKPREQSVVWVWEFAGSSCTAMTWAYTEGLLLPPVLGTEPPPSLWAWRTEPHRLLQNQAFCSSEAHRARPPPPLPGGAWRGHTDPWEAAPKSSPGLTGLCTRTGQQSWGRPEDGSPRAWVLSPGGAVRRGCQSNDLWSPVGKDVPDRK